MNILKKLKNEIDSWFFLDGIGILFLIITWQDNILYLTWDKAQDILYLTWDEAQDILYLTKIRHKIYYI